MDNYVKDLPTGLADPLHIFPPWSSTFLLIAIALLLLAILFWVLAYLYSKYRQNQEARPYQAPSMDGHNRKDTLGVIDSIRVKYQETRNYREGCHMLSAAVKTHIETKTGLEVEEMTPGEIARNIEGEETARFFNKLGGLQFNLAEPEKNDFLNICEESKQIVVTTYRVKA